MKGLIRLKSLSLYGCRVSDRGVHHLETMKSLESLSLGKCSITDEGIASLAKLKHLKGISLRGCKITDAGLMHITSLTQLERIDLSNCPVTDAGIRHIASNAKVTILNLSDTQAGDGSVGIVIQRFGHIQDFRPGKNTTDGALRTLASAKSLRSLHICDTKISSEGLLSVSEIKQLQLSTLELSGPGLGDTALAAFDLSQIEHLECRGIRGSDRGLLLLRDMRQLKSLTLINSTYNDSDLRLLGDLQWLEVLTLGGREVTDGLVPVLRTLSRTEMNLGGTRISNELQQQLRESRLR